MQGAQGVGGRGPVTVDAGSGDVAGASRKGKGSVSTVLDAKSPLGGDKNLLLSLQKQRSVSLTKEVRATMGAKAYRQYVARMDLMSKKSMSFVMSLRVLMQYQMRLHIQDVRRMFAGWQEQALMMAIAMHFYGGSDRDTAVQFEEALKELQKVFGADLRRLIGVSREYSADKEKDLEAIINCWANETAKHVVVEGVAASGKAGMTPQGLVAGGVSLDRFGIDVATTSMAARNRAIELAQQYLLQDSDLDRNKIDSFVSGLRQRKDGLSAKDYIEAARTEFADPTHQYIALAEVARRMPLEAGVETEPATLAGRSVEIGRALESLDDDPMWGSLIRAGLACAAPASELAKLGIGNTAENRALYRTVLLEFAGILETYNSILKYYGSTHFAKVLAFLIKSLGEDMRLIRSSVEPEKLMQMVNDLYSVEVLGDAYGAFEKLILIGKAEIKTVKMMMVVKNARGGRTLPASGPMTIRANVATDIVAIPSGSHWHFCGWALSPANSGVIAHIKNPRTTVILTGDATVMAMFAQK